MTKQIDREKVAAHISGPLAELTGPVQPKIDGSLTLLVSGHKHGDTFIDLYGTFDSDGYQVLDFTLAGSLVPLWDLQPAGSNICASLSYWCNDYLPSAEEMREDARQQMLIDRAELNKELGA